MEISAFPDFICSMRLSCLLRFSKTYIEYSPTFVHYGCLLELNLTTFSPPSSMISSAVSSSFDSLTRIFIPSSQISLTSLCSFISRIMLGIPSFSTICYRHSSSLVRVLKRPRTASEISWFLLVKIYDSKIFGIILRWAISCMQFGSDSAILHIAIIAEAWQISDFISMIWEKVSIPWFFWISLTFWSSAEAILPRATAQCLIDISFFLISSSFSWSFLMMVISFEITP